MSARVSRWWWLPSFILASGMTFLGLYLSAFVGLFGAAAETPLRPLLIPVFWVICPLFSRCMDRVGPVFAGVCINVVLWTIVIFWFLSFVVKGVRRVRNRSSSAA